MRKATQFTLRIHDRPGIFAEIASRLWNKTASIRAFSADVKGREGILRLVVDKVPMPRKAFEESALKAREEEVIVLPLPNKPESWALVEAFAGKKVRVSGNIERGRNPGSQSRGFGLICTQPWVN